MLECRDTTSEPSLVISAQLGKDDARSRIHDANEEECFLQKLAALCFTKTKENHVEFCHNVETMESFHKYYYCSDVFLDL